MTEQEPAPDPPRNFYLLIVCGVIAGPIVAMPILVGVLSPPGSRDMAEPKISKCKSNLRRIAVSMFDYARESPDGYFPHGPDDGIVTLQILMDSCPELTPDGFICPSSTEQPALQDPRGRFRLTPETCSYEAVPVKLRTTDWDTILVYERVPNHQGRRNVAYVDGRVESLTEARFQEELAGARARAAAGNK